MMHFGIFVTILSLASAQNLYCSIPTCRDPTSNTMCKSNTTIWGPECALADIDTATINATEQEIIVDMHNYYRRYVAQGLETSGNPGPQPGASNMRELKWDDELAQMAQTMAQQCVLAHDTCRDVQRFKVGQNLFTMISNYKKFTTSDWISAVQAWYNEVDKMAPGYASNLPGYPTFSSIGHYSQVVWATTYTVGCGVASYQDMTDNSYRRLHVCNYGPTGNWIGTALYQQGSAGSACPTGTFNNDGLCA